jgi:hypothetical protein
VTALAVEHRPLHQSAPPWSTTNGDIARDVAVELGFDLDEYQRWSLDAICAEDDDGLPAVGEFCVVGPRQTVGKSASLVVAAVMDVFVYEYPLHIWTAHEFKTARRSYIDMKQRISQHPDYASRCTFRDSHGEEAIILDTGQAIEFHARSGGSGRGFTTSRLTLDEWLYGQPGDLGALVPTLVTIEDAQVRYASSAGKPNSRALRALRGRGRAGDDPSLAYLEHGADRKKCQSGDRCSHEVGTQGCALDDRDLWLQANPGLRNGRVTMAMMERMRRMLPPLEFAREFLSWWEDPPNEGTGGMDYKKWKDLAADAGQRSSPVFAVATAPDQSWCAVAVAWRRPDGNIHAQLASDETQAGYRPGTHWVAERVRQLRNRWGGPVVVDTASKDLVLGAEELSEAQQARAHVTLDRVIAAEEIRHGNEAAVNTAIRAAQWKTSGNTRALDRKGDVDISPAVAVAMAVWKLKGEDGEVQLF